MINEIIKKRRSIRRYDPTGVVTNEQIKAMLEAAMLAPSAVNSRPWEFLVIKNREKIDAVTEFHPYSQMLKMASVAIIVIANPNALNGTKIEGAQMWQHDCGAATQNILLQAADMNLGTCWCGLHPFDKNMDGARKLFNIPKDRVPFCIIAIGVAAENFGSRGYYDENKVSWVE